MTSKPAKVYNVSAAASLIGASPSTVRNWVKQFGAHLSPSANAPTGIERVLTARDVRLLQFVKEQRDLLRDYGSIAADLASVPQDELEPYVDVTVATTEPPDAPPAIQPAQSAYVNTEALATIVQAALQASETRYSDLQHQYDALQGRVDAVEAKQSSTLAWFVMGIVCGVLIVAATVAIVLLGGSLR